jgi:hypothetical protein
MDIKEKIFEDCKEDDKEVRALEEFCKKYNIKPNDLLEE